MKGTTAKIYEQNFYDVSKQMPEVNANEIKDTSKKIFKWGDDNYYPNYLAYLKYACALHGGILTSKTHYTVSGGLAYEGTQTIEWEKFLSNGNSDFTIEEITENFSKDLELFNAYAFTISYVAGKPYQLEHYPFEKLRKGLDGTWRGSNDWSDRKEPIQTFEKFNSNNLVGKQLVVYMEKPNQIKIKGKLTKGIYPVPTYSGGVLAIETDIEINNYRRNEIANNFSLGTIINFNNGKPQLQEDEDRILDELSATTQGTSNAGGSFAAFNNGKDREVTVASLAGNNLDSRYLVLSKDNKENILLSHSVTSGLLFGVKTEGQLGGLTEIEMLYNLMKNGYFKYRQRAILATISYVAEMCGIVGNISFNDVSISLVEKEGSSSTLKTLNDMSPLLANKVLGSLTTNEIRKLANLTPVIGGDEIPISTPSAFNKEVDPVIIALSSVGRPKDKCKVLFSRPLNHENFDEENFKMSYEKFAISNQQQDVLNLLNKGMDNDLISKELGIGNQKLIKIINELEKDGLLKDGNVTAKGGKALVDGGKAVVSVVYSYEVKDGLGAEIIPHTREFCREMLRVKKYFTKAEIDQISQVVDRNVWLYKGGYYSNPKTKVTTTSCRHFWQQSAIIE
jgi:hypothetical protein